MWDIHSRNYLSVDVLTFWDWAEYSRSTCFFNNRWLFFGCFCSWWLDNWGNIVFQGFSFSFSHNIEWVVAGHWIFFQFRMVLTYFLKTILFIPSMNCFFTRSVEITGYQAAKRYTGRRNIKDSGFCQYSC